MSDSVTRLFSKGLLSTAKPVILGVEHAVSPLAGNALKAGTKFEQWYRYSRHHPAEIDPYRVLWINPDEIYNRNKKLIEKSERYISHVIGGDWDKEKEPFETHVVYQSLSDRFERELSWEETAQYQRLLEKIENGERTYGCSTKADLDERFSNMDELYESIRDDGFKPNKELLRAYPRRIRSYLPREIKVQIGRNGSFFYLNGKHRLSIAKILGIEKIPVNVIVRHDQWQALRNQMVATGKDTASRANEYLDHPDMTYVRR